MAMEEILKHYLERPEDDTLATRLAQRIDLYIENSSGDDLSKG